MEYFKDRGPPSGNGRCSDNACPCGWGGVSIPRGKGFLWIPRELVEFRREYRSLASAQAELQRRQRLYGGSIGAKGYSVYIQTGPILMCELGAKCRGLDLEIAASDAKHWWATGEIPLRPTPMVPISQQKFQGRSLEEAKEEAAKVIQGERIVHVYVIHDVQEKSIYSEGAEADQTIKDVLARIPSEAFDVSSASIIRETQSGYIDVKAFTQNDAQSIGISKIPDGGLVDSIECVKPSKKGLLGIGKEEGVWGLHWSIPFKAEVSYKTSAEINVYYKEA